MIISGFFDNGNQVEGMDKKVFGDAHAEDGYCKMIRKAVVSGEVKKGKFYATAFKFVES